MKNNKLKLSVIILSILIIIISFIYAINIQPMVIGIHLFTILPTHFTLIMFFKISNSMIKMNNQVNPNKTNIIKLG